MKRMAVAVASLALCILALPRQAQAMIEFCPAMLNRDPVGAPDPKGPLPAAARCRSAKAREVRTGPLLPFPTRFSVPRAR